MAPTVPIFNHMGRGTFKCQLGLQLEFNEEFNEDIFSEFTFSALPKNSIGE
jgi:hypothetical protein